MTTAMIEAELERIEEERATAETAFNEAHHALDAYNRAHPDMRAWMLGGSLYASVNAMTDPREEPRRRLEAAFARATQTRNAVYARRAEVLKATGRIR